MDNFINNEIENLINGLPLGDDTAQTLDKIKKYDFGREMDNISKTYNSTLNNIQYFKILTILSLKHVTWNRELREVFNISKTNVETYLRYLELNGFIINKQFIDLDDILYETILRTNSLDLYNHINKVHLIALTPEGLEFSKRVINDAVKLLNRTDYIFALQDINKRLIAFKKVYSKLVELENKLNYDKGEFKIQDGFRMIKFPDGTLIMKKTEAKKNLDREKKLLFLQNTQNKQLSNSKSLIIQEIKPLSLLNKNELVVLDELIEKEGKSVYNGIYNNSTLAEEFEIKYCNNQIEIENLSNGISNEEEKAVEKEYKEQLKDKLKYLDNISKYESCYSWDIVLNKVEETEQERKRNNLECLGFFKKIGANI